MSKPIVEEQIEHLRNILFEKGQIAIVNLGTFVKTRKPASININHQLLPPQWLISYLNHTTNTAFEMAELVEFINEELKQNGSVQLPSLGSFMTIEGDSNKKWFSESNPSIGFDYYGLSPVFVRQNNSKPKSIPKTNFVIRKKSKDKSFWLLAACFFGILMFGFWSLNPHYFQNKSSNEANLLNADSFTNNLVVNNAKSDWEKTSILKEKVNHLDSTSEKKINDTILTTGFINNTLNSEIDKNLEDKEISLNTLKHKTRNQIEKRSIVIGAFSIQENAKNLCKSYQQHGYEVEIADPPIGQSLYKVIIITESTVAANELLANFRAKNIPDAWLIKYP